MFNKYSVMFLIFVLFLHQSSALRLNIRGLEKSLLPGNSYKDILTELKSQVLISKTSDPRIFDNFIDKVKGMVSNLQADQDKHEEIHSKMSKQCTEELAFRTRELSDATEASEGASGIKIKCENLYQLASSDKENGLKAVDYYQAQKTKADDQRKAENDLYLERKADILSIQTAMQEFDAYMTNLLPNEHSIFAGSSFVQLSKTLVNNASKVGVLITVMPILMALTTPSDRDTANFKLINNALKEIITTITNKLADNEANETESVLIYNNFITKLTGVTDNLKANLSPLDQQKSDMIVCKSGQDDIISKTVNKISRNESLKGSAQDMCKKFNDEFTTATNSRLEHVQLTKELFSIIEEKFNKLAPGLTSSLNDLEDGLRTYVNSDEFKQYEFNKNVVPDSDHGAKLSKNNNNDDDTSSSPVVSPDTTNSA